MDPQIVTALQDVAKLVGAALVSGFLGFRYGLIAERKSQLRKSQRAFVPLVRRVIADMPKAHPALVWGEHREDLENAVWEFRMHLGWPRLGRFDQAWEECTAVKREDLFPNNNPGFVSKGEAKDLEESAAKIVGPLKKLMSIAEGA